MTRSLIRLAEPKLLFRHGQALEDPRDGLTLFGTLDEITPFRNPRDCSRHHARHYEVFAMGSVDTGIRSNGAAQPRTPAFSGVSVSVSHPVEAGAYSDAGNRRSRTEANAGLDERHQRVFKTVNLYAEAIERALNTEEARRDVWFVVIPDYVRRYCRPRAIVAPEDRTAAVRYFKSARQAKVAYDEPFLFDQLNEDAEPTCTKSISEIS